MEIASLVQTRKMAILTSKTSLRKTAKRMRKKRKRVRKPRKTRKLLPKRPIMRKLVLPRKPKKMTTEKTTNPLVQMKPERAKSKTRLTKMQYSKKAEENDNGKDNESIGS